MPQTRKRTRQQTRAAADVTTHTPHATADGEQDHISTAADENEADGADVESGDEDDEEQEELVLSEQFDGSTDTAGRPHGRGTLTVHFQRGKRRGRNVFNGRFSHGLKSAQLSSFEHHSSLVPLHAKLSSHAAHCLCLRLGAARAAGGLMLADRVSRHYPAIL